MPLTANHEKMLALITISSIGVLVLFAAYRRKLSSLLKRRRSKPSSFKRPSKERIEAEAILLSLQPTGVKSHNLLQVKLQMQVNVKNGRNFVTEVDHIISYSELSRLRIGSSVIVRYNPANTKEVLLISSNDRSTPIKES